MTIPSNIDPARALALCFGVRLPRKLDDRGKAVVLDRVCTFLEIPALQLASLIDDAGRRLKQLIADRERGPGQWLQIPQLAELGGQELKQLVERFSRMVSPETERFLDKIIDNCRLPEPIRMTVCFALLSRAIRKVQGKRDPGRRTRGFCMGLVDRNPEAYRRAYQLCMPYFMREAVASMSLGAALQPLSRIMYRLACAQSFRRSRAPHEAVEAAFGAWEAVYESFVSQVCLFLWCFARPTDDSSDSLSALKLKEPSRRHDLFRVAREWCDREGIVFPFYRNLDRLVLERDLYSYEIDGRAVHLFDRDGEPLEVLSVRALVHRVEHDTVFAFHFVDSISWAIVEYQERVGAVAEAWETAVQFIPELATAVKPLLPRRRRLRPRPKRARVALTTFSDRRDLTLLRELPALLLDLFSASELRIWLAQVYGADLVHHLPGDNSPAAEVCHQAVLAIKRRDSHYRRTIFTALLQARPLRRPDIGAAAARCGLDLDRLTAVPDESAARARVR